MKKKIIFVLSFLTMVLCLTGCSTKVKPEQIREMTAIAQNIKDNASYQLPDGYTYELVDNTQNNQIVIKTTEESSQYNEILLTFDIAEEEVQLLNIEVTYITDLFLAMILGVFISFGSFVIIMGVIR